MTAIRRTIGPALLAFGLALAIAALILLLDGHNPLSAYLEMWRNIDGSVGIANILNNTGRLYVGALAVAIGFKMNLFNIGANGQLLLAALFAGAVGGAVKLPPVLHVGLIMLTACAVGAAYAGVAGVLKVTRNVNEVVATIMLNGVAVGIIGYMLRVHLRDTSNPSDQTAHTTTLPASGRLPHMNRLLKAIGLPIADGAVFYSYTLIAVVVGVLFYILIYRTRFGYDLRASGVNAAAARSSGVNPKRMVIITMLISGALAGLGSLATLLCEQYEYGDRYPGLLGFTAIGIALLGQNNPIGIAFAAFVWSAIEQGARALPGVEVPLEIGQLMQGILLFVAVIVYALTSRRNLAREVSEAAARTTAASVASTGASTVGAGA